MTFTGELKKKLQNHLVLVTVIATINATIGLLATQMAVLATAIIVVVVYSTATRGIYIYSDCHKTATTARSHSPGPPVDVEFFFSFPRKPVNKFLISTQPQHIKY